MSNKNDEIKIDTSAFNILDDIKKKEASGEEIDEYTKEALKTIEFASALMDSILSGRHIDLAFYKAYTRNAITNIRRIDKRNGIKRVIKTRIENED